MKRCFLIKFSADMLKRLHESGIKMCDYEYVSLYEDYERMREDGYKMTYIVAVLCKKYGMCERKVYKVLKHFCEDC